MIYITQNDSSKVETYEWETMEIPFERIHVDYRPYINTYFFVFVDAILK